MGSFLESFDKGMNFAHMIEGDKRLAAEAQRRALVHQQQMNDYARKLLQWEQSMQFARSREDRAVKSEARATAKEKRAITKFQERDKATKVYPKGWNESIGRLQSIQKKLAQLESGQSEFGVAFEMTPNVRASINRLKQMEQRQKKFIQKRFPKTSADYFTEVESQITQRKQGETILQYIQRTTGK